MKLSIKTLFALALAVSSLAANAQGMSIEPDGTLFANAVKKAKAEKKMVFLDCYTSWCGPCKMMAKDVFPQQSVGDFMNPRYVCIKIDMEKGEGPALAKKLEVSAYPTFVIFNNDGKETGRFLGGSKADEFIERVKKASVDNGSSELDKRFADGDRSEEFLKSYLKTLGAAHRRAQANTVAEALLEGKAETFAADSTLAMVFMRYIQNPFCEPFKYTAKHPETLVSTLGDVPVEMKMRSVWTGFPHSLIDETNKTYDKAQFDSWVSLMQECGVKQANEYRLDALIDINGKLNDWNAYTQACKEYWNDSSLDVADLKLCRWCTPVIKCGDANVKAEFSAMLKQRMSDLESGKREPQKKQGNMILSGNLSKAMEKIAAELSK